MNIDAREVREGWKVAMF